MRDERAAPLARLLHAMQPHQALVTGGSVVREYGVVLHEDTLTANKRTTETVVLVKEAGIVRVFGFAEERVQLGFMVVPPAVVASEPYESRFVLIHREENGAGMVGTRAFGKG